MSVSSLKAWWRARRDRGGDGSPATMTPTLGPTPTLRDETVAAGVSIDDWVARRRRTPALYVGASPDRIARLRAELPGLAQTTIAAAERSLRHEFDLLGSGPFRPVDPDRPARDGYQPIDWYLDPVRCLRFPRGVPHKDWKLYEMRPGDADVKYPWELARCQHWATLAQSYLLTGDERFAGEIFLELDDFVEANPAGMGINWTCTMDVAIRAANWAIGLDLARGSRSIDESRWARAYAALFDHGVFIRRNLENTYEVTSNHFLSNVAGLWFLGAVFADLPEGQAWGGFARDALEQEMTVQVLPDGADFESSVPYHRLVAELFLGCARLGDITGSPLSPHYLSRVRAMVSYLAGVLRPDGLMPQVGDADDGRLHVLTQAAGTPQDARHLFGPAGGMFASSEWTALGGDAGRWEAAWWGYAAADSPLVPLATPVPIARLYPDAGIAVAREAAGHYLLVTNGKVGTNGFGNHKHNDQLSFEYHVAGVPLVVDPGSFVYTSDAAERNRFRGTAYHSTIAIDGVEQNDLKPEWLFRLFESARAEHVDFSAAVDAVVYRGRHVGYTRLDAPVMHERGFRFERASGALLVSDRLEGYGRHALHWHVHLAPGVEVAQAGAGRFVLTKGGGRVSFDVPAHLEPTVSPAWYSPSYGVRVPCQAIDLKLTAVLDGVHESAFGFQPL